MSGDRPAALVARFVAACCRTDAAAVASLAVVHAAYVDWAREAGEPAITANALGRELRAAGHYGRSKVARFYRLRLVDPVAAAPVLPAALAADRPGGGP